MSKVYSNAGNKFYVSTTVQNADLTESQFIALSYTEVGSVGSVGEFGINTNMLSYDLLSTVVAQKAKGITNAGDPPIECARDDADAGQSAMKTIGAPDYYDAHAFYYVRQDGSIDYLRGLCAGPNQPNGRNEDFDLLVFTLGLVQQPIHRDASV